MSVVINTNYAATLAANNLASSSTALQRSLNRLASGSKIIAPQDDAAGLAVSMKLSATARRQNAISANLGNAASFLQTQDGVLNVVSKVLSRVGELKTLAADPTKNSSDIANYNAEFSQLQDQLTSLAGETFNGKALFGTDDLTVATTEDGTGTVTTTGIDLLGGASPTSFSDTFATLSNWTDTSTGGGTATPGGGVTLSNGAGAASITSNATFSGATTIEFTITSGDIDIGLGGSNLTGFIGFTGSTIRLELDGNGNMETFVDNVSLGTVGGNPTSGQLKLSATSVGGGGSGSGALTNFSVTSAGGGGSGNLSSVTAATDLDNVALSTVTSALQDIATYRAQNGAAQSRLGYAAEVVAVNKANIEAANSRITDVDVAEESTSLARYNILVQSGTAMLTQANQSAQMALRLLG